MAISVQIWMVVNINLLEISFNAEDSILAYDAPYDRLRTCSERGKRGRMFIYFFGLILASYVRSVWQKDDVLRKKFSSTEAVLAEMRTIRCIEHTGKMKVITPFVGSQVDICKDFGFAIPDSCAPVYVSKAKSTTAKEVARLSRKWKHKSFRYTKLKNSERNGLTPVLNILR